MHQILLWITAGYFATISQASDANFKRFCVNPPNFGKGVLSQDGTECELKFSVTTADMTSAYSFCETQHPFSLKSATNGGQQTTCKITTHYRCHGSDVLIGKKCFIPRKPVEFKDASNSCGRGYNLHRVHSIFEQKWISAFLTKHNMLWIANTRSQMSHLKFINFEGRTLHNREARLVSGASNVFAILTRKGATAGITAGTITSVSEHTPLPVLCSTDAEQLESYIPALVDRMGEAGLRSFSYKDSTDKNRGFLVFRNLHIFEMDGEFEAGPKFIHDSCKGFVNGYAASPLDFADVNSLKQLLKEKIDSNLAFLVVDLIVPSRLTICAPITMRSIRPISANGRRQYIEEQCILRCSTHEIDISNIKLMKRRELQENVNIVVMPGQKISNNHLRNLDNCAKDPSYRQMRAQFKITLPSNVMQVINEGHYWQDSFPDRTCADTPRVALGFTQKGLIDLPAIARHFAVCTYGQPPPSSATDVEKTCHRLANYDKEKNQCACKNPEDDITKTKLFPTTESERSLNPGVLCLDCDSDRTHDVFLVVDFSHQNYQNLLKPLVRTFMFTFAIYNARIRMIIYGSANEPQTTRADVKIGDELNNVVDQMFSHGRSIAGNGQSPRLDAGLRHAYSGAKDTPNKKKMVVVIITQPSKDPAAAMTESNQIKETHTPIHVFATPDGGKDSNIHKYGSEEAFIVNEPTNKSSRDIPRATTRLEKFFIRSTCLED
ncbi:hypothetical protein Y032_0007g3454 [Ancylostoma ceylanicum]|uniref:VWFA domain-containing protein n=1 Tax=Ancylostoma ceylanicum TaxID=53326 RepID=A0A016VNC9_9BILA|nr:hypothetical protein Y032_0007g3454 [Ancylostoma ceylanicum]